MEPIIKYQNNSIKQEKNFLTTNSLLFLTPLRHKSWKCATRFWLLYSKCNLIIVNPDMEM